TEVDLGQLLRRTDEKASDDRAGNRREAAEDQDRQGLQRDERERELDSRARAPEDARRQRDEARDCPDDDPNLLERDPDGERRLVIVRDGPERASDARLAEEKGEDHDLQSRHAGREEIELADVDPANLNRHVGDADIQTVYLSSEDPL